MGRAGIETAITPNLIPFGNASHALSREADLTPDGKVPKEISANREKSPVKRKRFNWRSALGWDWRFSPSRSQKLGGPFDIIDMWATRTLKGKNIWHTQQQARLSSLVKAASRTLYRRFAIRDSRASGFVPTATRYLVGSQQKAPTTTSTNYSSGAADTGRKTATHTLSVKKNCAIALGKQCAKSRTYFQTYFSTLNGVAHTAIMLPRDIKTGWYVCPICEFEQLKPSDFCLRCGHTPAEKDYTEALEALPSRGGSDE